MPHGLPDYSMYLAKTIHRVVDIGELATRLGSIDTFDRRGDVVWFDDFESDLNKWEVDTLGTGAAVVASAEKSRNGAFSAKLTTGNAIDDYADIFHYLPFPVVSKVGFEISFTILDEVKSISICQLLYDGSYMHYAVLRYDVAFHSLYYWDENGTWQLLAEVIELYPFPQSFHSIKFVIDLATYEYVRVILNSEEIDMSGLFYQHSSNTSTPYWMIALEVTTGVNDNISIHADDAIITQNEP